MSLHSSAPATTGMRHRRLGSSSSAGFGSGDGSGINIFWFYNVFRIRVVFGKAIFGPPLEEYWKKKLMEDAAVKETDANST